MSLGLDGNPVGFSSGLLLLHCLTGPQGPAFGQRFRPILGLLVSFVPRRAFLLAVDNRFHYQHEEMYICVCRAVTDGEVESAIENGADSLCAVARACGAGGDCGSCHETIERMLEGAACGGAGMAFCPQASEPLPEPAVQEVTPAAASLPRSLHAWSPVRAPSEPFPPSRLLFRVRPH